MNDKYKKYLDYKAKIWHLDLSSTHEQIIEILTMKHVSFLTEETFVRMDQDDPNHWDFLNEATINTGE